MRSLFFAVTLSFGLPSLLLASPAQHAATAPAPAVAMHAAPSPMHAAPTTVTHSTSSHSTTAHHSSSHGASSARLSTRPLTGRPPVTAPPVKAAWLPGLPPSSIAPIPSSLAYTNSVPLLLPGSAFFGHHCFSGLGCYGQGNHFKNTGVIIPFVGFGGFYIPVPYYEPAAEQGEEAAPSDVETSERADTSNQSDSNQQIAAEQPAAPEYYPPSEPIYEFVFVKRDGTKIFAVAYSLTKDKVQYVTREGLRRSLPLDSLDFGATQKSNEERGNSVNLPSPPPAAMAMTS